MSVPPKLSRWIAPPTLPQASFASAGAAQTLPTAIVALQSKTELTSLVRTPTSPPTIQRLLSLHPCEPLAAYILDDAAGTIPAFQKLLVVQNLRSRDVYLSLSLGELAAMLYSEQDTKKLPAAAKSLGTIIHLAFYDPGLLYWSGMMPEGSSTALSSWRLLCVQTTSRAILINLKQNQTSVSFLAHPSQALTTKRIAAHLSEKTLNAIPSSNVLPLTAEWIMVGCTDGSLKCIEWTTGKVIKSIKGLGKGDWIVQLLAANTYASTTLGTYSTDTSAAVPHQRRRILTVTKKGIVYLIELTVLSNSVEIQPPIARFVGGWSEIPPETPFEHELLQYDAHRDWILWLAPAPKSNATSLGKVSVLVWNLRALQTDLLQQMGNKNIFKPDPTLTIYFTAEQNATTVFPGLLHAAFGEDTVACASISVTGNFFLQVASHPSTNTIQTVTATPVMGVSLAALITEALGDAVVGGSNSEPPPLRVHSIRAQPLVGASQMVVATHLGLLVVDMPASNYLASQTRHLHLGAGLGSLGKALFYVQQSSVIHGSLDVLKTNPVGLMEAKNTITVYESPAALHMPPAVQKWPFRMAPTFLPSPSGLYVCVFWPSEFRYEILHLPSLLEKVRMSAAAAAQNKSATSTSATGNTRNPLVASGSEIVDFCWIGDDDVYAVLHARDLMQATALLFTPPVKEQDGVGLTLSMNLTLANLTDIRAQAMNVANLATTATKSATKVASKAATTGMKVATTASKAATSATLAATKATTTATKAVTSATLSATSSATKVVRSSVKTGVKKSLGLFGKKFKSGDNESSIMDETNDDMSEVPSAASIAQSMETLHEEMRQTQAAAAAAAAAAADKRRYIELRKLVAVESQASELSASIAAATSSSLGELVLRGGNRVPPVVLFGGPVLCVGSRGGESQEGHAQFYTCKKDEPDDRALSYISTGPSLPFPDNLAWDDDGRLCAVVVQNRVAVYCLDQRDFVLLGTVQIGSPLSAVTSVRFVHGTLFACTLNSIYCVMLGSLEGGVSLMDSFLIASTNVPSTPTKGADDSYTAFQPTLLAIPLVQPEVLGYQCGSLIVSTLRGVQAVPLRHPLLRIGALLASGQVDRAAQWFDAIPDYDHEALATFLERRGFPDMALQLTGISVETAVDISMRYGYVNCLEDLVETHGVKGLKSIDNGRGVSRGMLGPELHTSSMIVCIGAYLLAHGRVELTRRLATECLRCGEEGKKDAFLLGALLLPVDEADAGRLIHRAVVDAGNESEWLIGQIARDRLKKNERSK